MTTLLNRDVFERDPDHNRLDNNGVSQVGNNAALLYELRTFVCEGEYADGFERILDAFLSSIDISSQPSAWVSGFYGSGKSHLVKMLEALWRNEQHGGQYARDIARLTPEIKNLLTELTNQSRRAGGLWSASGMLTSSSSSSGDLSVRMLILGIVHRAAGLSSNYGVARFRLWLKKNGWEESVLAKLASEGLDPATEFEDYLVSPVIADAVWEASGRTDGDPISMQLSWEAQFNRKDVSIDDMERGIKDVLMLHSSDGKQLPLTLIVLDEVQQYIGDDGARTQAVQEAVERIQSAFDSRVLVVATGQAALSGTPNLQKLQGRFTITVMLSDKDVETVVRQVVLKKDPTKINDVNAMIKQVEGEIDRHLQRSKIGPRSEDKDILVPNYPLLPTRGRFWASLLHKLDPTGTSGTLRTQLRVVHSAVLSVADKPLGHVIPADFLFDQLRAGLQQSGTLPKEVNTLISGSDSETGEGRLRARLIELIFLINQLPGAGDLNDAGVKATDDVLADLIVEYLPDGSAALRSQIPPLLQKLVEDGTLLNSPESGYAIQTGESIKWQQSFKQERQGLSTNQNRLGELRSDAIETIVRQHLGKSTKRTVGASKVTRELAPFFGIGTPPTAGTDGKVIVWVRDGWTSTESTVQQDAFDAGDGDPIIQVFVPQRSANELRTHLLDYEAARRTVDLRGGSQDTQDGQRAAESMRSRMLESERRYQSIVQEAVRYAVVMQGGGSEVEGNDLAQKVDTAFGSSLLRMYPRFDEGDAANWSKVFDRAIGGNPDALREVHYDGEPLQHPVLRELSRRIPATGIFWAQIRKQFQAAPFGWPQDGIDAGLAVLVGLNSIRAVRDSKDVRGKDFSRQQANAITLISESTVITPQDSLRVRSLMQEVDGIQRDDDRMRKDVGLFVTILSDLAAKSGGEPPLPLAINPPWLAELGNQVGNQLIKSLSENFDEIKQAIADWKKRAAEIEKRRGAWEMTMVIAHHARHLPEAADIQARINAIRSERQLLFNPDPLAQPAEDLATLLRGELQGRIEHFNNRLDTGIAELQAEDRWLKLEEKDQRRILHDLQSQRWAESSLSGARDLRDQLAVRTLEQWDTAIKALPPRIQDAETEMIRLTTPGVRDHVIKKSVIEDAGELERWLEETSAEILELLANGHKVRVL